MNPYEKQLSLLKKRDFQLTFFKFLNNIKNENTQNKKFKIVVSIYVCLLFYI